MYEPMDVPSIICLLLIIHRLLICWLLLIICRLLIIRWLLICQLLLIIRWLLIIHWLFDSLMAVDYLLYRSIFEYIDHWIDHLIEAEWLD